MTLPRTRAAAPSDVDRLVATIAAMNERIAALEVAAGLVPAGAIDDTKIAPGAVTLGSLSAAVEKRLPVVSQWRRVSSQTVPHNTLTAIAWDTEDVDPDGVLTPTSDTFTAAKTGLWMAQLAVSWSASMTSRAAGWWRGLDVHQPTSNSELSATANRWTFGPQYTDAGNTWQFYVFQTNSAAAARTLTAAVRLVRFEL